MADIVFLSHTARTGTFRVGSHHLTAALAASGHRVAHISTPFSRVHSLMRPGQAARRAAAGAGATMVGGVIDLIPRPLLPANVRWTPRQMQAALDEVGITRPEFVFIDQPLFPARHFAEGTVVFRPTDIFRTPALQRAADAASIEADAVAATSPGVLSSLVTPRGPHCVIENGVEFDRFSGTRGLEKEYDFVYVGAIDFRFDFHALACAARRLPAATFVIYGPRPLSVSRMPVNVELRGPIEYDEVPSALARGRVGVMPFTASASNTARSPMKLYEYLAAGLPVVAPDYLSHRVDARALHAFDASDPETFAEAAAAALAEPRVTASDTELARGKDWSRVAAALLSFASHAERESARETWR